MNEIYILRSSSLFQSYSDVMNTSKFDLHVYALAHHLEGKTSDGFGRNRKFDVKPLHFVCLLMCTE